MRSFAFIGNHALLQPCGCRSAGSGHPEIASRRREFEMRGHCSSSLRSVMFGHHVGRLHRDQPFLARVAVKLIQESKNIALRRDRRCKFKGNNTNSSITLMHLGLSDGDSHFCAVMVQKRMSMWSGSRTVYRGRGDAARAAPCPRRSPGSRRPPGLTLWRSRQLVPRDSGSRPDCVPPL